MIPLDDCYNLHKGTAVLVPGGGAGNNGQCEQWADLVHHDVYGHDYVYTPAAKDWWYKFGALGLNQFYDQIPKSQPVQKGDFVVYDPLSTTDPQGHIDVCSRPGPVTDFWAYDSNWDAAHYYVIVQGIKYPSLHEVHHNDVFNSKVIGYLRPKGGSMPTDLQVDEMIAIAHHAVFGTNAPDIDFTNLRPIIKSKGYAGVIQMLSQYDKNPDAAYKHTGTITPTVLAKGDYRVV